MSEQLRVDAAARTRPLLRGFELDEADARRRFEAWRARNMVRAQDVRVQGSYMPFLYFEGELETRLDGAIGYTVKYEIRGRQLERTDWYVRQNIILENMRLPTSSRLMQVLASLHEPRNIVNMAMLGTNLERDLRVFEDERQGKPYLVQEVSMRPSFALYKILANLERQAEERATDFLLENPTGHFVEVREGFFARDGGAGIRPEDHERRPDKARIRHLFTRLYEPVLCKLVYLPAYVINYKVSNAPYIAVVNGVDGRLAGIRGQGMDWQRRNAENLRHIDTQQNARFPIEPRCWRNHTLGAGHDPRDRRDTSFDPRYASSWWSSTQQGGFSQNSSQGHNHEGKSKQNTSNAKRVVADSSYSWSRLDDFQILGIARIPPPSASDISRAFREEAKKHHPDMHMHRSEEDRLEFTARFRRIRQAFVALRRLR
ncbi:Chaperone protein dnaJ 72 [Hondaea fermentalgiana]|uniref:Chaperone protein dnaJ 72 n=1 Tax=Hondaea fermentalgiana TaxID=2315210 RepID=A0A2R5H1T0_9STRA|nr:Chaperone protein dnaJ 72 [Hondaea fermentalgiana]|eukprot:GBG34314.1 Chaperone protein dnaJ 72 [Hondaea fermentalgiana]